MRRLDDNNSKDRMPERKCGRIHDHAVIQRPTFDTLCGIGLTFNETTIEDMHAHY